MSTALIIIIAVVACVALALIAAFLFMLDREIEKADRSDIQ